MPWNILAKRVKTASDALTHNTNPIRYLFMSNLIQGIQTPYITTSDNQPVNNWQQRHEQSARRFLNGIDRHLDYSLLCLIRPQANISNATLERYINLLPLINNNQLSNEDTIKVEKFHQYIRPYVEQIINKR